MKAYQKKRLVEIKRLEKMLPQAKSILQRYNILEQIRLMKRLFEIDEKMEKRLKGQK
jgi:hypothetical protein